ncbi:hypothetical protein BT93_B1225 [Corymbia citriodora subsp. variegata]|nr:hypothetical protein BT93_B1225 [Corymbia citriodora subsp. variegata]
MEETHKDNLRLMALCRQMGDLWAADDFTVLDASSPEITKQVGEFLLYGKLFSKPNVNFQAFLNTMRKAWKLEDRVLQTGPWSFASNLLVLQEGDPQIPEHCYNFTNCSFWVHLVGLPRAAIVEDSIKMVAGKLGMAEAVKIEARNNSARKVGKAKVKLNLLNPLKTGTIIHLGGRKWWIDFKYERLPHFCYSCGSIESGLPQDKPGRYGSWLEAEAKELSPCWNTFYGEIDLSLEEEEMVPETPNSSAGINLFSNISTDTSQAIILYNPDARQQWEIDNQQHKGKWIQHPQVQNIYSTDYEKGTGQSKIEKADSKKYVAKKLKCFAPYGKKGSLANLVDMENLTETPIQMWEGAMTGALVAGPNKPPQQT